jgi:3-hydroxyacyl-[acyl-carrier protein] dehydratase/trans-2-decenoyl-[acyl-carrier protein] isomerase
MPSGSSSASTDGWLEADGKRIYEAKDLRVGLFKPEA